MAAQLVDVLDLRAGDRSAQDHSRRRDPAASRASRAAAGGTAGGRARARVGHPGTRQVRTWCRLVPRRCAGGAELLVDGWLIPCSVAPPAGIHRQPRAQFHYWAGLRRGRWDVPVITQLLFQQSFVEYVEVPQTEFSVRVVDSVASQRQVRSANCGKAR